MENPKREDIIIELGSEYIRLGLVGDRCPRKTIKSAGHLKWQERSREKYSIAMEQLLYNIFFAYINCPCAGKTIIILQKVYTDKRILEVMAHIMFKKFKVEKIEFALSCVTPLYLSGKYHGITVLAGASVVEIMPVFEGFPIVTGFQCVPVGTSMLNRLIKEELLSANGEAVQEQIKSMSDEELVEIRNNFLSSIPASQEVYQVTHRRTKLKFQPSKISFAGYFGDARNEDHNIAHSFLESLSQVPDKCLDEVCKNIVLAGGMWRIKGMQTYFKKMVAEALVHFPALQRKHVREKLGFVSWSFNPCEVSWMGCSIGASIRSVDSLSLKKNDYMNDGFVEKIMECYFLSS